MTSLRYKNPRLNWLRKKKDKEKQERSRREAREKEIFSRKKTTENLRRFIEEELNEDDSA